MGIQDHSHSPTTYKIHRSRTSSSRHPLFCLVLRTNECASLQLFRIAHKYEHVQRRLYCIRHPELCIFCADKGTYVELMFLLKTQKQAKPKFPPRLSTTLDSIFSTRAIEKKWSKLFLCLGQRPLLKLTRQGANSREAGIPL